MSMTKIRAGDIVTVQIRVTEVAPYPTKEDPSVQQVMGRMLPRGDTVGWLVPQEAAVTIDKQNFKVGDTIWLDGAQSQKGHVEAIKVGDESYLWVRHDQDGRMLTVPVTKDLRRVD